MSAACAIAALQSAAELRIAFWVLMSGAAHLGFVRVRSGTVHRGAVFGACVFGGAGLAAAPFCVPAFSLPPVAPHATSALRQRWALTESAGARAHRAAYDAPTCRLIQQLDYLRDDGLSSRVIYS